MRTICPICQIPVYKSIFSTSISLPSDTPMDGILTVLKCSDCLFHFTQSKSLANDYATYYSMYNNYTDSFLSSYEKDQKCYDFLSKELDISVNKVIDYGCGNGKLSNLLSQKYTVTKYDIGELEPNDVYDCLILSHVLEHIYDPFEFIKSISKYIKQDGYIYIEIPNASKYDKINIFGSLQEINIEHINFFSKYALSKLLIKCGYTPILIKDCSFTIVKNDYYVIRGIFQKSEDNLSMEKYIEKGTIHINKINQLLDPIKGRIFIYGCGQFLYKILTTIKSCYLIEMIIDDNPRFIGKQIENINIINFNQAKKYLRDTDTILLTVTDVHHATLIEMINSLNLDINIIIVPLYSN